MIWNVRRSCLLCSSSSSPSNFAGQKHRSSKEIHLQNPKTGGWWSHIYSTCHLWPTVANLYNDLLATIDKGEYLYSCFHAKEAHAKPRQPSSWSIQSLICSIKYGCGICMQMLPVKSGGNCLVELFSRFFVERFTVLWWTKCFETKPTM